MKKNIILVYLLTVLSLSSYAGTVTPHASFGVATDVKVGTMITQNGTKVDLMVARNAKGDVFVGKAQYVPGKGTYYGTYQAYSHVRGANGAVSKGTVPATITQQVSKRKVIDEILQKARSGGRALGKGAASAGRLVGLNTPYGRAFALATAALEGSKFFWSDEEQDFVRQSDDDEYLVFSTTKASGIGSSLTLDEKRYQQVCENKECQKIGVIKGKANAQKVAEEFCKSRTFQRGNETVNFDSIGWSGFCYSEKHNTISSKIGVKVARWIDYVPMTADEFFDESEPDADNNPNEWVETSGVEPTDEPEVEVPAGTVAQTDPYTDPKDGKAKQTRWDFEGKGRVRETTIERPDLTPGSPEAPELKPPAEEVPQDPNNGDKDKDKDGEDEKDKEKPETEDLCEKNPDVLACDKQPEKPELDEFPEIPTETVNLKFTPDSVFPNAGQCPAPVSFQAMGATYQISTQPICDVAEKLRPFIIALAYLVAAFFVIRTIKSETA